MAKEIWLNLGVKDVYKTKTFFESLGFQINQNAPNSETLISMSFGSKKFIINFFREDILRKFVNSDSAEHANSRNLLISIDAENEAEVDAMLYKAEKAGGIIYAKGGYNQGWMYGGGFLDLDGHQWNLLYMDMSKATSKP